MDQLDPKDGRQTANQAQDEAHPEKKTYAKPAFRFEKVFETMALACGKVSRFQFTCQFNRKNS